MCVDLAESTTENSKTRRRQTIVATDAIIVQHQLTKMIYELSWNSLCRGNVLVNFRNYLFVSFIHILYT